MSTRKIVGALVCAMLIVAGVRLGTAAVNKPDNDARVMPKTENAEPKKDAVAKIAGDEKGEWAKIEAMGQAQIPRLKKGEKPAGPDGQLSQQQKDDYIKRMTDQIVMLMKAAEEFQKNYPLSSHLEESLTILAGSSCRLLANRDLPRIDRAAIAAAEKNVSELSARKDLPASPAGVLDTYKISLLRQNVDASDKAKTRESIRQQLAIVQRHLKTYPADAMFGALYLGIAEFASAVDESGMAVDALKELANSSTGDLKEEAERRLKLISTPLDLKFTALDGRKVDLAAMKGKVVLIDFWATWCGPCIQEFPNVKKIYEAYHDKGFEIVGISLDESKSALQSFIDKNNVAWPQHFDGKGWGNEIGARFGIRSIPAMWLIGKDGKIATMNAEDNLESKIKALLGGKWQEKP